MTAGQAATLGLLLEEHRPGPGRPANILRTLIAVQERLGHVPVDAVPRIAEFLAVSESDIAGVLSYYPDLHSAPRGRRVVRLCLGEACVANRAAGLLPGLRKELGIGLGETSRDGRVTLEQVYCLGNCAVGPTVMVDDHLYGRVTGDELPRILNPSADR